MLIVVRQQAPVARRARLVLGVAQESLDVLEQRALGDIERVEQLIVRGGVAHRERHRHRCTPLLVARQCKRTVGRPVARHAKERLEQRRLDGVAGVAQIQKQWLLL